MCAYAGTKALQIEALARYQGREFESVSLPAMRWGGISHRRHLHLDMIDDVLDAKDTPRIVLGDITFSFGRDGGHWAKNVDDLDYDNGAEESRLGAQST